MTPHGTKPEVIDALTEEIGVAERVSLLKTVHR